MKTFKYLVASLISISFLLVGLPANAEDPWLVDFSKIPDNSSQVFIAENGLGEHSSRRFMMPNGVGSTDFAYLCPEGVANDGGPCDFSPGDDQFNFESLLPKCQSASEENCVEGLSFFDSSDTETPAQFIRQVKGTTFEAIEGQNGLYRAGTESLWQSPGPDGDGVVDYAVIATAKGYYDWANKKYVTEFLEASVLPYRVITGSQYQASNLHMENYQGKERVTGWAQNAGGVCAWTEDGQCGRPTEMEKGLKLKLTLRVSSEIKGWFKGRIDQPSISISRLSATNSKIEVTAKALTVPRFSVTVDEKTLTDTQRALITNTDRHGDGTRFAKSTPPDRMGMNGKFLSLQWLDSFREISKDTAIAESTLWNFSTIRNSGNEECMDGKSGVLGIVTTNATAFTGVMPTFENKFFKYEVAGLHFASDGKTLNEGTYDLVMQSDFARCLYGFSKAPISATISVVSDTGENKVATTLVNETKGWISLRAAGFTYSSPTISVKLTQAKPKKLTITCVKGKIIKKVSGTSPKCPAGYKKK